MARRIPRWLIAALTSAALLAAVTTVIALLEPDVPASGLVTLYLLAVVPIALAYGVAAAAAVSLASLVLFDFFFLPPRHSLNPGSSEQWEVLAAFLVSSLVISLLAGRSQREARRSARLASEQAALRHVATLVARGTRPEEVFTAVVEEVGGLLSVTSAAMGRYDPDGMVTTVAAWSTGDVAFAVGGRWHPEGKNVTSIVFQTGGPARIDDFADASGAVGVAARGAGYRSAVGAPVIVEGRAWGLVSAASTGNEPLPPDTEERLAGFTDLAATAIANAESRAALGRLADQQAALRRVATLVARGVPPTQVFSAVVREVGSFSGADLARMERYEADGTVTGVAGWSRDEEQLAVGTRFVLEGVSIAALVLRTNGPVRVDTFDQELGPIAQEAREIGIRSSVGCPVVVAGQLWGVIAASSRSAEPFPAETESQMAEFTQLVATAIANAESQEELRASRARIVAASDLTRRRIERDLHDGVQQRLVSLTLGLRAAMSEIPAELDQVHEELAQVATGLGAVFDDLREISRGIHPAILTEGGLGPALRTLARRSPIPVDVEMRIEGRLPDRFEVGVYYTVAEVLTNAAKHSEATVVRVDALTRDDTLYVSVSDDGIGGADFAGGSGLVGLRDRVEALGGALSLRSPRGEGTALEIRLPLG